MNVQPLIQVFAHQKQNEQALLDPEGTAWLARSQEEPTYLIELTSNAQKSSSFCSEFARRRGRAIRVVSEPLARAIPALVRNRGSVALQRERRRCDNTGGL